MSARYAELQVTSNFSFLEGGSHPSELLLASKLLGHEAMALTDRNTLAGIVRAHVAADQVKQRFIIGCRLDFTDRPSVLCWPTDKAAYSRLSQLLTHGKKHMPKGQCAITAADLDAHGEGQMLAIIPPDVPDWDFFRWVKRDAEQFGDRYYVVGQHLYRGGDAERLRLLENLARDASTSLVATNDVLYHAPERRPLQDVISCIRLKCKILTAGRRLDANAERHMKRRGEMARLFRKHPEALQATLEIVRRCTFSLGDIEYEYPDEVPEGRNPQQELEVRVERALVERYPAGASAEIRSTITRELALIAQRKYAPFFLTVHDIVGYAKSQGILCQGRGSAANSAVCFVLGITAVDPAKFSLLFERFISTARNEPPDIDVDFSHERREEVIQHIYQHYTRERCGIAATVICYRTRSAVREVGKVMGLSTDSVSALTKLVWGWSNNALRDQHIREAGLDPDDIQLQRTLELAGELTGFPRHLSQHVGGFVITRGPLADLVPICNAAMKDRTNIEWDKDDLDAVKMLKVDVLGLGMLTCIDKSFQLIQRHYGERHTLYSIPQDVPAVYEMIQQADTIGVFQIESRAQMTMLPRLKPKEFYDLVIEVAIVRPGPIQGDMVHPYLRRRQKLEEVDYQKPELEAVLKKTLGVPLFQEQAMQIAIVAAGFTPDEADGLRRAMATFKHVGTIHTFEERFVSGMLGNGYTEDFATRCFQQIKGFGTYGFPESHAVSFAFLAYDSSWLKWRYPDVFACALLNSQPMGFYAPAQIVRDAREHDVEVRPVDVNHSDWDCTLETTADPRMRALRLGFRLVKGCARKAAEALVKHRGKGYASPEDLARRSSIGRAALATLARADAFRSIDLDRRAALWAVTPLGEPELPLLALSRSAGEGWEGALPRDGSTATPPPRPSPVSREREVVLPPMSLAEHVVEDYGLTGFSLKRHPVALLRERLAARGIQPCITLKSTKNGKRTNIAGLVLVRQRPGTASGVIFMTLEDETGIANVIVWPSIFERYRKIVMTGRLIGVIGQVQQEGIVIHVVANRLLDLSDELARLDAPLTITPARADEVTRPGNDQRGIRPKSRDFH